MSFRLGTFKTGDRTIVGIVIHDVALELTLASDRTSRTLPPFHTLADLLGDWDRTFETLFHIAEQAVRSGLLAEHGIGMQGLRPLPPLGRQGKQLYAAANYRDHVDGMRKNFTPPVGPIGPLQPLRPYMFGKICEPTGAYDDIVLPSGIERTDWEAELMVVVGQSGKKIRASRAKDHIAGYMTTNDVSCRDLTWRDDRPTIRSDWLAGKSFDTFAPMGPWFTPKAFVEDHANLAVRLWVNGELKQDGNTGDMTFGVEEQIEYASRLMTLVPGDLIATGTPAGTGQERLEFLKPGDVVETEVEFCGRLRNTARADSN